MSSRLAIGLYETLISSRLEDRLSTESSELAIGRSDLVRAEAADRIAQHLATIRGHRSAADLKSGWRLAKEPTLLQELGRAISLQQAVAALRFPSVAARSAGLAGWNVAIYPAALAAPD